MIHTHSVAAHAGETAEGNFGKRAQACLEAVRAMRSATDRMVRDYLQMSDMNMVRPRLTELVRDGWLEECGEIEDTGTHKMVRVLRVVQPEVREARISEAAEMLQTEFSTFLGSD